MITFVINYWAKDAFLARQTGDALRLWNPSAEVVFINDEPRLKKPDTVGAWVKRYLSVGSDVLVKVDPDTEVMRRLEPPVGEVFCALKKYNVLGLSRNRLHAGAIGFSLNAREAILSSGLLEAPRYRHLTNLRDDYNEEILLEWVLKELGIPVVDVPTFACGTLNQGARDPVFRHR